MITRNPQINIRLKPELKDKLHELALANGNSVNSEIVTRLETSIISETPKDEPLTALEAKKLSVKFRKDVHSRLFEYCVREINKTILLGLSETFVDLPDEYEENILNDDDPIFIEIINPILNKLTKLGYSVTIENFCFHINF